jgi:hypothetical protein
MKRNSSFIVIAIVALFLFVFAFQFLRKEAFTSPGTMVQLASSHVPTEEDYNYYRNIYPKIVRRDLTDMTGEDPGPIAMPIPQLWI